MSGSVDFNDGWREGRKALVDALLSDEARERVMEAVAAEFGACANATADKVIAAALAVASSEEREP